LQSKSDSAPKTNFERTKNTSPEVRKEAVMSKQEIDQQLVEFALPMSWLFLKDIPNLDQITVFQRIMAQVCAKFKEHHEPLHGIEILEVADLEFHVTVNGHARGTFMLERKEAEHER